MSSRLEEITELIGHDLAADYEQLRLERHLTWEQLSAQFAKDAEVVPNPQGHRLLAEFCELKAALADEGKGAGRGKRAAQAVQTATDRAPRKRAVPPNKTAGALDPSGSEDLQAWLDAEAAHLAATA